jgi:hypothetical protein
VEVDSVTDTVRLEQVGSDESTELRIGRKHHRSEPHPADGSHQAERGPSRLVAVFRRTKSVFLSNSSNLMFCEESA